jgi:hypothetical protein
MTLNFGPSLSPDGRWIVFLSTRSFVSTDLYVADAKTGRVVRRLTSTATDPHYASIQFINSSGTWDPSSERVAIGTIVGGRAAIGIVNAKTGRRDRDIVMRGIDGVLNPAWAPDGHAIAFTGMRQGLTDLYVYEMGTGKVRQLTTDAFADLHPAWSPDSRRIVFATDRFTSDLESLQMGAFRLAIAEATTGALEQVLAFDNGKHINPQWSNDGESLYFVADPHGIPNVYRVGLANHEIAQITTLGIGVSGITPSSPALSLSWGGARLAATMYENERFHIYISSTTEFTESPRALPGDAAVLSPPSSGTSVHRTTTPARNDEHVPPAQAYPTEPYKPAMALVDQASSGGSVGVGRFGAGANGGAAFTFSDMLGDRVLSAAAQIGTPLTGTFNVNDLAYQTGYLRQDSRWSWAIGGGQIPYVIAAFNSGPDADDSGGVLTGNQFSIIRETQRTGSGMLLYPFNRASRIEFSGAATHIGREEIVTSGYSTEGALPTSLTRPLGQPLELLTSTAALVSDSTTFGPTSPVQGQRYRLEVARTVGTVDYTGVLVDYRRYAMPIPFYTIAARVIHFGRYGTGADDPRLHSIYVSDPSLVRGYDITESFPGGCVGTSTNVCLQNSGVVGNRIVVTNLEFRFPLLRTLGVGPGMYGPIPVEVALFGDGGVAWRPDGKPDAPGGAARGISSVGIAFRLALGFAAAEFDAVRPFQRPEKGWTFGFNLIPGW